MPLFASSSGGESWTAIAGTTQTVAKNNHYIANNVAQVVFTLPSTSAVGDYFSVAGKGAGGWKIAQLANQKIYFGTSSTTTGTGGSLASTSVRDSVRLVCTTANLEWNVVNYVGNVTIV